MDLSDTDTRNSTGLRSASVFQEVEASTEIVRVLEFFSHQPNFSEFCQFAVLDLFAELNCWGACIATCKQDGYVEIVGSFGLGDGLLNEYQAASFIKMPMANGVYLNGQLVSGSAGQGVPEDAGLFRVMNSHGPNALGLIANNTHLVGFFQLLFFQPIDSSKLTLKLDVALRVLRALLPIYEPRVPQAAVSVQHSEPRGPIRGNSRKPDSDVGSQELTQRQLEVLQLIVEGKTNALIARQIGFSDSTVRQETIEIYRKLGVHNRRDAAVIAERAGLLSGHLLN